MAQVVSAVAVATAYDGDRPVGQTVSSFMSVSLTPPTGLISLHQCSRLRPLAAEGKILGLNVLGATQRPIAEAFAKRASAQFDHIAWDIRDGAPRLLERHGWVALRLARIIEVEDHSLLIGGVVSCEPGAGKPLTHWRRGYGVHAPGVPLT